LTTAEFTRSIALELQSAGASLPATSILRVLAGFRGSRFFV
jgi:hypothetical protein